MSSRRSLVRHGKSPNAQTLDIMSSAECAFYVGVEPRHRQGNKTPFRVFHAQIFPSFVRKNLSP